jgi:hypothetical protein
MELNPVVHNNGSLSFGASNALNKVIWSIKGQLLGILLPLSCIFLSWSIRLFNVSGKSINPVYLVAEAIFAAVAVWVSYNQITRVGRVVVKIGNQLTITDEMVSVKPFTFNIFLVKQKPLCLLAFKINELKIRKTENPLRFTRALDNRVFELRDKEKEAYIVFDYFDPVLKEKLMDILVEVTPPELLRPGRLRHY